MLDFSTYLPVPRWKSKGKKFVTCRWHDVQRKFKDLGDDVDKVRSRWLLRDYATEKREDLFAPATSPGGSRIVDFHAVKRGYPTMIIDAESAFMHVLMTEEAYCEPPQEWLDRHPECKDYVWKVLRQMQGQRGASQGWTKIFVSTQAPA